MTPSPTHQTNHAIILAAGFGSRLDAREGHKLLVGVGGRTLLAHHLDNFAALGVGHVTVVTGYRNQQLAEAIAGRPTPGGVDVHTAFNADFESSNGISVLAGVEAAIAQRGAAGAVPFWLTMSDHLYEPALIDDLAADFLPVQQPSAAAMLAVDHKLDTIFDIDDANKIARPEGQFEDIGKGLGEFGAVDTGLFWCNQAFVDALKTARGQRGDCNTSDAVARLAEQGRFDFWDVGGRGWQDIDTPPARAHAERLWAEWTHQS